MQFSDFLARLHYLMQEYPALGWGGVLLPLVGVAMPSYPLRQGYALTRDLAWPVLCACCAVAVYCVHLYDGSRRRVQTQLRLLDRRASVGRDLCFSSAELQQRYDRWWLNGKFSWALDYYAVFYILACHAKLAVMAECSAAPVLRSSHQRLALPLTLIYTTRLLCRRRLSCSVYSRLSLAAGLYIWFLHTSLLASGDQCFGGLARELYRGPIPAQLLMSCAAYGLVALCTPVSQAYVPFKAVSGFAGCVCLNYMHMLFRDGAVDPQVDGNRWAFFWMFLAVAATAMAYFHCSTRLSEMGMTLFLTTTPAHSGLR